MDAAVPVIEPVSSSSPTTTTIGTLGRNDNSNPQQGSGTTRNIMTSVHHLGPLPNHGRPSLKIPPTKKDSRKLFVGGLPVDSKLL